MRARAFSGPQRLVCIYLNMARSCNKNGLVVRTGIQGENPNLIYIHTSDYEDTGSSHDLGLHTSETGSLNNKNTIVYSEHALRTIGKQVQRDQRLRILPFGTISAVRKLKLNCNPTKNKLQRTPFKPQSGINHQNLITTKTDSYKPDQSVIFGTCNIQSLRFKELQVSELLEDYSMDFIVLTET